MKVIDHFRKQTGGYDAAKILYGNMLEGKECPDELYKSGVICQEIHQYFLGEHKRAEFWESQCEVL